MTSGATGRRRATRPPGRPGTVTAAATPCLADYDVILVNSSGGKDSQATLEVVARAAAAGLLERVVVVHADLGEAEWPGVPELVAEHAAHYGLRFEVVARRRPGPRPGPRSSGTGPSADAPGGDRGVQTILERVEQRGMWPGATTRWCTSDHKRGPVRTLMTRLVAEQRASGRVVGRPVHMLNVMGFRALESRARARHLPYAPSSASNGRRRVDDWFPIHDWTLEQVWTCIHAAGTRWHPAYDAGMSRLSCRFCVLASIADLVCSARLNPQLAAQYAATEAAWGTDSVRT